MNDRIKIDIDAHGVADVRLVRADKMNALDNAMITALLDTPAQLAKEKGLRAVVLSGEGRAFCAGLDMSNFQSMGSGELKGNLKSLSPRTHGDANAAQQAAAFGWINLPVPVIAAIHGVAFGGGFQLTLGADIRYVTPDAKLSVMEIKWGLVPDMGGMEVMRHLVRADVARELTYSGRIFSGDEAVQIGLATRAYADPLTAARELARQIANSNPDAIRANKRIFNLSMYGTAREILLAESVEQERLMGSANQTEAVRAQLEKRAPVFVDGALG